MPAEDELAALRRELDDVRNKLHDVRAEQQRRSQELVEMLRSMGLFGEEIEEAVSYRINNHGMTRRAALVGIVGTVAAGSYLAGTERARADSTGQLGTSADPLTDVFADSVEVGEIGNGGSPVSFTDPITVEALTITEKVCDISLSFSDGQTRSVQFTTNNGGDRDAQLGERILATAVPDNDPDNDHGYTVDKIYWDDGNGRLQADVTETESSGGGDARITGWVIGV